MVHFGQKGNLERHLPRSAALDESPWRHLISNSTSGQFNLPTDSRQLNQYVRSLVLESKELSLKLFGRMFLIVQPGICTYMLRSIGQSVFWESKHSK